MKKTFLFICLMLIIGLAGCSTVCPPGVKFGPYGVLCAPYEAYEFGKEVPKDFEAGGVWNQNGTPPAAGAANAQDKETQPHINVSN